MQINSHKLFFLCIALAAACYWPGLSGDYMFDDKSNILNNKSLALETLNLDTLLQAAFSSKAGELRRPVSMVSFALNHWLFGFDPWSYKLVNLCIHLITGLLLFLLTRQITTSYRLFSNPSILPTTVQWIPVAVCGLWLVHPINLTSVLYIVQRMTSLSSLFMVFALYLYMAGRLRLLAGKQGLALILTGYFGFGALAVLSKETGVLLPLYLLVLEVSLFRFRNQDGRTDRTIVAFTVLCIILPLIAGLIYLLGHTDSFLNYTGREFNLYERLMTEARVVVFYLKLIVLPTTHDLGLFHDDISISTGIFAPISTIYSLLFLASLLASGLWLVRKNSLIGLGILWFFVGHLLESTIFPLEIAHEHRNYLPGFGIILAIITFLASIRLEKFVLLVRVATPVLLFAAFWTTTWNRSMQWSDNINHAIYEARHHPDSPRAVFGAGRIHARLALQGRKESIEDAYAHLKRAHELDSTGIMPATTLIKLSNLLDRPEKDDYYGDIIYRLENYPLSASDVVSLQTLADCIDDTCDIPHQVFEKMFHVAMKGKHPHLLTIYGYYTINKLGDFDKGLEIFNRVVEIAPHESQYWRNLVNLLMVMYKFDEAQTVLQKYRTLKPLGSSDYIFNALQKDIEDGRLISTTTNSNQERLDLQ